MLFKVEALGEHPGAIQEELLQKGNHKGKKYGETSPGEWHKTPPVLLYGAAFNIERCAVQENRRRLAVMAMVAFRT